MTPKNPEAFLAIAKDLKITHVTSRRDPIGSMSAERIKVPGHLYQAVEIGESMEIESLLMGIVTLIGKTHKSPGVWSSKNCDHVSFIDHENATFSVTDEYTLEFDARPTKPHEVAPID